MVSKISEGIKISVETAYQPDYSNPALSEYMFSYKITIENNNKFSVKLLGRHWFIYDSNGTIREVQGEGVVGVKPQINSGKNYQYISSCNLRTEIGKMNGTYLIENINENKIFKVIIPTFQFTTPFKLN